MEPPLIRAPSPDHCGIDGGIEIYSLVLSGGRPAAWLNGATTEQWKVTFGTQSFLSTLVNNPTHDFQPWAQQTMTFTASTTSQVLTFLSQGGPDGLPSMVFLDSVSLVQQTPEPSSLVYACLGLSGLMAWRLRNKRA
jgi:hypothetical protein